MKFLAFLKKWWSYILIALCAATLGFFIQKSNKYEKKYEQAMENVKAYHAQFNCEKDKVNAFQMDIATLEYYNDSLMQRVKQIEKENKIKDNKIKQLSYLETEFKKSDTITLMDTIFKEPDFALDTTIGDEWMNTRVMMRYPNTISVTPNVKSEKTVVLYSNKETIEPPKKFFLCRWFQKKQTVIKAVIDEQNPYITNQKNEFYEIVK